MRIARILMVFAIGTCFAVSSPAQDYPTKPVKVIVPFTAESVTASGKYLTAPGETLPGAS